MKTVLLQKDKRSILLSVTNKNSAKSPKSMPGVRCLFCSRLRRKTFVLEVSFTLRIRNNIPRLFVYFSFENLIFFDMASPSHAGWLNVFINKLELRNSASAKF